MDALPELLPPERLDAYLERPEVALLLACCRRVAGTLDDAGVGEVAGKPFDEGIFEALCIRHHLPAVAHAALVREHAGRFSPGFLERLAAAVRKTAMDHLRQSKAIAEIHAALAGAGIRHVFLKGPVLNRQLFGEELFRQSGDLDVLVELAGVTRVLEVLKDMGYSVQESLPDGPRGLRTFQARQKDVMLWRAPAGPSVELHWRTDRVETILDTGFEWDRDVITTPFQGGSVPVLPDTINALYLCQHAARHHWQRFQWALDIPLFALRRGVGSQAILAEADFRGLRVPVMEAAHLARRLLGLDPWPEVPELSGRQRARLEYRFSRGFATVTSASDMVRLQIKHGFLYERAAHRVRFWGDWILRAARNHLFSAGLRGILPEIGSVLRGRIRRKESGA